MHYLIHPGYLWIAKHEKKRLPPITEADQFMFAKGHAFEAEARKLFPDGVSVEGKPWEFAQLVAATKRLMEQGEETIFQATAMSERGLLVRSDILQRRGEVWDLYEVKSSTRVKDDHLLDLGFQTVAWEEVGITIGKVYVYYVNRDYALDGKLEPDALVAKEEVTEAVRAQIPFITKEIPKALALLDEPNRPDLDPKYASSLYIWLPIYLHLHPDLPDDHPYRLAQLKPEDIELLEADGAATLGGITEMDGFNTRQQGQIEAWRQRPEIKHREIRGFLDKLSFPLWFLDYETISHAIPLYDGTKPYQNIPFQYSLHKLDKPDGELSHFEYLATDQDMPVPELLAHLKQHLGDSGSILVWYENFEKSMNQEMGEICPEHREWMEKVNKRIVDLMVPFANGWYIDKFFKGSASLKNVLPVLAPHRSYKELGVQDGGSAQAVWYKEVFATPGAPSDKVLNDLIEYCKLDTLAMVEIYQFLRSLSEDDRKASGILTQQELF